MKVDKRKRIIEDITRLEIVERILAHTAVAIYGTDAMWKKQQQLVRDVKEWSDQLSTMLFQMDEESESE